VEIYGENKGDVEKFDENYMGYINSNTLRAGYPESKRCGEALCQAYIKEKGMDIVIPRLPRIYGPTMQEGDSKAVAQFIKKAVNGEDIVLKSDGSQYYSFLYVVDAVIGVLAVMLNGTKGEAYNIADESNDITLKDAASLLAETAGVKVVFEIPDAVEKAGYSTATKAILDAGKIQGLGWKPMYTMENGLRQTVLIMKADMLMGVKG
jgi:nucleoside-diphosphate-sugar epimerase